MHVFKQSPMRVSKESQEELETVIVEPVSKADIQGTMLADTSLPNPEYIWGYRLLVLL